jgi:hypothetical protein
VKQRRRALKALAKESRRIVWRLRKLHIGAFFCRDTKQVAQISGMLQEMRAFREELRTRTAGRHH